MLPDNEVNLTDFQRECLEAISRFRGGYATAIDISVAIRGNRRYRLAVSNAMTKLLYRHPDGYPLEHGLLIARSAPRDRWDSAKWYLSRKGWDFLGYDLVDGRWKKRPDSDKSVQVAQSETA